MKTLKYISIFVSIFIISSYSHGQEKTILDFQTKDLSGQVIKLSERLDLSKNYLIETMAFWCAPCVRSIDRFHYHENYWRDEFNLEIVLLEDEHFDDLDYVVEQMASFEWTLPIFMSNSEYSSVGITSIPRYYFVQAHTDSVVRVLGDIEQFLFKNLDATVHEPIFTQDFSETVVYEICENAKRNIFDYAYDTLINNQQYFRLNKLLLREEDRHGSILRYDLSTGQEVSYLKYSSPLCSREVLRDFDGDSLVYKVMDVFTVDSLRHILTDQYIKTCDDELKPFVLMQGLGSNAGIGFDIENETIISRLVCHQNEHGTIYQDESLGYLCQSTSTKKLDIESQISIFPNPTRSQINIHMPINGSKDIILTDAQGIHLSKYQTEENIISIALDTPLVPGLYWIRIQLPHGPTIIKKVIVAGQ